MAASYEELMAKARELHAAGRIDDARRVAEIAVKRRDEVPQDTNLLEQGMTGVNTRLARAAGAPVDLVTGALNLAGRGVGALTGLDVPQITDPVGGSGTFETLLAPTISDVPPQTRGQRIARRVGEEVGSGALLVAGIPGVAARMPGAAGEFGRRAIEAFPRVAAADVASDVGAGLGASVAQELAPDSPTAEIAASLLGGLTGGRLAAGPGARRAVPSVEDLRKTQDQAYDVVGKSDVRLTPPATERLSADVVRRMTHEGVDEVLHPKATRMTRLIEERAGRTPTVEGVEDLRRIVGRDVAGALDPSEARLGSIQKDAITEFLDNLKTKDVISGTGDAGPIVEALRTGREATKRIKKSELLEGAVERAERQAATSGTGGNLMNTVRQRVNSILNNPKQLRGFSPDDVAAMQDIVRGTPSRNALRWLSRFSPTTGNLSGISALGQGAAVGATGNPLFALPATAGFGAKVAGEALDKRQLARLLEQVRAGGRPQAVANPAMQQIIASLLAQQSQGQRQ